MPARNRDEVGLLSLAFNRMLGTIEQRSASLHSVNKELHDRRSQLQRQLEEQRMVEGQLSKNERFTQQIADSVPLLLYVQDLSTRRTTYVNRAVESILGHPAAQVVDFGLEVPRPDDRQVRDVRWRRLEKAADGDDPETEYQVRRADGAIRWLLSRDTILERDENGNPRLVLGVASDVTEERALQERLAQAQKMESIGRLAGGVAHDFNNLLTVIVGCADMVHGNLPTDSRDRLLIENVLKATEQATQLTHQLLAFARKQIIEPKILDVNSLVLDAEKILRSLLGDDIEFALLPRGQTWPVRADPSQMMQVLMNLAVNARDAMPDGGRLLIETANVQVTSDQLPEAPPGDYVSLAVSDTGEGLAPEVRERIFEPFFTTKQQGKGTGLGLSTCYGIVKQSDGFLQVDSELGEGTTFRIYLPRVSGDAAPLDSGREQERLPAGEETLLLVEDNTLVRVTAVELLRSQGYRVLEAAGGPDALRLAEEHDGGIDLLVTDVVMPQMSGKEVADRLVKAQPGLKVLFVSGYTPDTIVDRGELHEGIDFLQKPYTTDTLVRKVREVLDR